MRKPDVRNFFLIIQILFLSLFIVSCSSTKKIKYFQDIPDSGQLKTIPAAVYVEPKIQVDDILSVTIQTVDPSATQTINTGNVANLTSNTGLAGFAQSTNGFVNLTTPQSQVPGGYLVDKDGDIDMPILGKIHALGETTSELKSKIRELSEKYYNNPNVVVRYANFKISITGEVLRPGVYIMPNEKVSILDAIAMSGDLTIFGQRDNVLLIRENLDGTRTPYRINLKKSDIMYSSYYYLRQNDVIYVEPSKSKAAATDAAQARNYTIIGSLLSVLVIYLTRK